jgi:hypothetical protein
VRRPAAHKAGRHRFVPGKARANTAKALVLTDAEGRLLFCGQTRPGAIHDLTQVRQAGLVELLTCVMDWCYGFYNHQRRHTAAAGQSPINYENAALNREAAKEPSTISGEPHMWRILPDRVSAEEGGSGGGRGPNRILH